MSVRGWRNLAPQTVRFGERVNLLHGANGQGKTSLLEALAALSTSRSFRTEQMREVVSHGALAAEVSGQVRSSITRHHKLRVVEGRRRMSIDEKPVVRITNYARHTPIVVFSPQDRELVAGPASLRRTLLDRIMLYEDPIGSESRQSFLVALRARQKLLSERGAHARGLEAYEALLGEHGVSWYAARQRSSARLVDWVQRVFTELAPEGHQLTVVLESQSLRDPTEVSEEFRQRRIEDIARGRASFGPQRDELSILLDQHRARHHASQGQQRLIALSLKLAELNCIRTVLECHPILLLDDVASELDRGRTAQLMSWVMAEKSQVFVTTTSPDTLGEGWLSGLSVEHFEVRDGILERG